MFLNRLSFQGNGLQYWDTSNIRDMRRMFRNAPSFNGIIANWNVSQVRSMKDMFFKATSFNADVSGWDVSMVENMSGMCK